MAVVGELLFPPQRGFASGPERDLRFYATRLALGGAVVACHLLVLLAVLYAGWAAHAPAAQWRLTAVDLSAPREPSTPARRARTPRVERVQLAHLLPSDATAPMPLTASGSGEGTGCATTALVAGAIRDSPEAMAALAVLPAGLRTEADAVMLWNGAWLPDDDPVELPLNPPEDPFAALKQVVIDALAASPAVCLDVDTTGPQLIPIQEPGRTTMLVVGSGVWRWSSIVVPPLAPDPEMPGAQAAELSMLAPAPTGN